MSAAVNSTMQFNKPALLWRNGTDASPPMRHLLRISAHAVGEANDDVRALIAAASEFGGPGILVPTRNAELFRWCLENGLRVVQPATLMTLGLYNEPAGAYLPSILF
jgi:hypothetical protein